MLYPRRSEQEHPAHPRTCQVDRHILTSDDGGEPIGEVHVLADLHAIGDQGGAIAVTQLSPGAVKVAADVGAGQADRAAAGAGGSEPAGEEHVLADLQAVGDQSGAGVVRRFAPSHSNAPPIWAPVRLTLPPGGGEPAAQEHVLADSQAVRDQGRTVVAQARPGAVELAADVGADQADRTVAAEPVAVNPPREEHVLIHLQAVGLQGGAGVVTQICPGQSNCRRCGRRPG